MMEQNRLMVNTLFLLPDLQSGVGQADLLNSVAVCGVGAVEIRREFIHDFSGECREIHEKAESLKMQLYYSVPDTLFDSGTLKRQAIERYFVEASIMGCTHIKLNIGEYGDKVRKEDISFLNDLCSRSGIALTVENDQTAQNGRLKKIQAFLECAAVQNGSIGMTFDIGNWLWQQESSLLAAGALTPYTTEIHLKDVVTAPDVHTVLLDAGEIDWRQIIREFSPSVPIALEYPCMEKRHSAERCLAGEVYKLLH